MTKRDVHSRIAASYLLDTLVRMATESEDYDVDSDGNINEWEWQYSMMWLGTGYNVYTNGLIAIMNKHKARSLK